MARKVYDEYEYRQLFPDRYQNDNPHFPEVDIDGENYYAVDEESWNELMNIKGDISDAFQRLFDLLVHP